VTHIFDQDHARVGHWMPDHGAGIYRDGASSIGLEVAEYIDHGE
jgi:hypothetical protein